MDDPVRLCQFRDGGEVAGARQGGGWGNRDGGRRFTTLAATFEPFPSQKLLAFLREFVSNGGRLIWSGPPPVLTAEGGRRCLRGRNCSVSITGPPRRKAWSPQACR